MTEFYGLKEECRVINLQNRAMALGASLVPQKIHNERWTFKLVRNDGVTLCTFDPSGNWHNEIHFVLLALENSVKTKTAEEE